LDFDWIEEFKKLPEAIVTYEIEPMGEVVRLAMTESLPNSGLHARRRTAQLASHSLRFELAPRNRTRPKNSGTATAK
jgi:hypothetical protein